MRLMSILFIAGLLVGCADTPRIAQKHGNISGKKFLGRGKGDIDALLGVYVDFERLKPLSRKMRVFDSPIPVYFHLGDTRGEVRFSARATRTEKGTWRVSGWIGWGGWSSHEVFNGLNVFHLRKAPEEFWISLVLVGKYYYVSEWIHVKLQHRNWLKTGQIPVLQFPIPRPQTQAKPGD